MPVTKLLHLIRKDLADPMGSLITTMLLASLITLSAIGGIALERKYLLDIPDSVRAVDAEDDCAYGTKDVRRYNGQLYCIGEQ
jgi:hypothetical protein